MINGLIGRILMQDIDNDGLYSFTLSEFGQGVGELNLGVLDKLFDLS